jgi:hypothetical protein
LRGRNRSPTNAECGGHFSGGTYMPASLCRTLLFVLVASSFASAEAITGAISGTCGFISGSPSNVVYSESFSGQGTFGTGFMSRSSFVNDWIPAGWRSGGSCPELDHGNGTCRVGAVANFSTTLIVQQQYLITSPTTATGFARTFLFGRDHRMMALTSASAQSTWHKPCRIHRVAGSSDDL